MADDCAFCRNIGAGTFDVIAAGERVLVVADAQPINRGHLLVLPIRHAPDLVALTADEVIEMALAAQRADRAIRSTFPSVDGTNLVMSNGDAADQGVLHAHLHVIPRLEGDGYEFREDVSRYPLPPLTADERDALRAAVSG